MLSVIARGDLRDCLFPIQRSKPLFLLTGLRILHPPWPPCSVTVLEHVSDCSLVLAGLIFLLKTTEEMGKKARILQFLPMFQRGSVCSMSKINSCITG